MDRRCHEPENDDPALNDRVRRDCGRCGKRPAVTAHDGCRRRVFRWRRRSAGIPWCRRHPLRPPPFRPQRAILCESHRRSPFESRSGRHRRPTRHTNRLGPKLQPNPDHSPHWERQFGYSFFVPKAPKPNLSYLYLRYSRTLKVFRPYHFRLAPYPQICPTSLL